MPFTRSGLRVGVLGGTDAVLEVRVERVASADEDRPLAEVQGGAKLRQLDLRPLVRDGDRLLALLRQVVLEVLQMLNLCTHTIHFDTLAHNFSLMLENRLICAGYI